MSESRVCPRCGGSGKVMDDKKIGALMRDIRKKAGVSLRAVALQLGLSAAYVCDLELGRRGWNAEKRKKYREAVEALRT